MTTTLVADHSEKHKEVTARNRFMTLGSENMRKDNEITTGSVSSTWNKSIKLPGSCFGFSFICIETQCFHETVFLAIQATVR